MSKIQYYSLIGVILVACLFAFNMDTESQHKAPIDNQTPPVKQSDSVNETKEFYPGIVQAHSLWVENIRYLYDYKDGFYSGDKEFLLQQVREGKIFFVENPAGVACSGDYEKGKIIEIRFFEGRYKNKSGYIFADFVQRLKE